MYDIDYAFIDSDDKIHFQTSKKSRPAIFTSGKNHFLYITKFHQLFGGGSNEFHQLSDSKISKIAIPQRLTWITDPIEIACGDNFSIAINSNHNIYIQGEKSMQLKMSNSRGLSAFGSYYSFACSKKNIVFGSHPQIPKTYLLPFSPLMTAICGNSLYCLDWKLQVHFLFSFDSLPTSNNLTPTLIDFPTKIISIYSSPETLLALGENSKLYVYQNHSIFFYDLPVTFPCKVISAQMKDDNLMILFSDGKVGSVSSSFKSISYINPIPQFETISGFSLYYQNPIYFKGKPKSEFSFKGVYPPIISGTSIQIGKSTDSFVCLNTSEAFLGSTTLPISSFSIYSNTSYASRNLFSSESKELTPYRFLLSPAFLNEDDSDRLLFNFGFIKDDIITLANDNIPRRVVGYAEGGVWVTDDSNKFVVALPFSDFKSLKPHIKEIKRENSNFVNITIDCSDNICSRFGHYSGELVWLPHTGIVQVIGVEGGELIGLNFMDRSLISLPPSNLLVLRSSSIPKTRDIITFDGSIVTVSIVPSNVFSPMDRVMTLAGEGTVLGFRLPPDDAVEPKEGYGMYISLDALKIKGIGAVCVLPEEMVSIVLLRRIAGNAWRTFLDESNNPVKINLSTECNRLDFVQDFLPGDIVLCSGGKMRIVGFDATGKCYGAGIDNWAVNKPKTIMSIRDCKLIYRSDIFGLNKNKHDVTNINVQNTAVLPGDLIEIKDIGLVEIIGYSKCGAVGFVSSTGASVEIQFSLLMNENYFKVIKRLAFCSEGQL